MGRIYNKELVDNILATLECTEDITREFVIIALDDVQTFDEKQRDYGPGNIKEFGEFGVLVRVSDKFARLRNLLRGGMTDPKIPSNESIDDSWKDTSVYGIIARLVRHGIWDKQSNG